MIRVLSNRLAFNLYIYSFFIYIHSIILFTDLLLYLIIFYVRLFKRVYQKKINMFQIDTFPPIPWMTVTPSTVASQSSKKPCKKFWRETFQVKVWFRNKLVYYFLYFIKLKLTLNIYVINLVRSSNNYNFFKKKTPN